MATDKGRTHPIFVRGYCTMALRGRIMDAEWHRRMAAAAKVQLDARG